MYIYTTMNGNASVSQYIRIGSTLS